jgi:hypothetical protein
VLEDAEVLAGLRAFKTTRRVRLGLSVTGVRQVD